LDAVKPSEDEEGVKNEEGAESDMQMVDVDEVSLGLTTFGDGGHVKAYIEMCAEGNLTSMIQPRRFFWVRYRRTIHEVACNSVLTLRQINSRFWPETATHDLVARLYQWDTESTDLHDVPELPLSVAVVDLTLDHHDAVLFVERGGTAPGSSRRAKEVAGSEKDPTSRGPSSKRPSPARRGCGGCGSSGASRRG